jgi:hypothetical protein
VVQGGIGYLQYFNDIPELLVVMHIVGSGRAVDRDVQLVLSALEPLPAVNARVHAAETRTVNR